MMVMVMVIMAMKMNMMIKLNVRGEWFELLMQISCQHLDQDDYEDDDECATGRGKAKDIHNALNDSGGKKLKDY